MVELDRPTPGFITGANAVAHYHSVPASDGDEEVYVAIVEPDDQPQAGGSWSQSLDEHFGLELGDDRPVWVLRP